MRISDWSSDVCSSDLVDQGIGLHAVTADELLEEAVLQRLAQDGHAGAVPIVDEHQRIGTPASELGELRAVGGLAVLVCGAAGDLAALETGRASCRERVCRYVSISGVAVSLKKQQTKRKAR